MNSLYISFKIAPFQKKPIVFNLFSKVKFEVRFESFNVAIKLWEDKETINYDFINVSNFFQQMRSLISWRLFLVSEA